MIERKRLEKEKYTIEGEIDKAGVLFKKYTYAYSGAQAKKQVAIKLGQEYPHLKIFLVNISIARGG